MGADDRADILDQHIGTGELLLDQGFDAFGIFEAVRIQDDDGAFFRIGSELQHLVHDEGDGLFTAADLVVGGQGAVNSFGNNGFQVQHGADGGGCGGDPSAALEVFQVVHDKVRLGTELVLLQPGGDFLNGFSGTIHLMGFQDQQSHGTGNPQGIHNDELPFRILLEQLFTGTVNRLQGAAELAGESNKEQILFLQDRLEIIHISRFVQGGGDRNGAVAHGGEITFVIKHLAKIIKVFFAIQGIGHVDDRNVVLLLQVKRQVAVTVCHKNVSLFHGGASFKG